jgi:hypothetical protein
LDDLHIFDTAECKWHAIEMPEPKPSKRSGFQMVLCGDTVVLYGGYTKEVVKGQKARGVVHTGMLLLSYPQLGALERSFRRDFQFISCGRSNRPFLC